MGDAKPLASLSSGLLARKGAARPAMRRPNPSSMPDSAMGDDLGWNDMGYDVDPQMPQDGEAGDEGEKGVEAEKDSKSADPLAEAIPEAKPAVHEQQEEIARRLGGPVPDKEETQPEPAEPGDSPEKDERPAKKQHPDSKSESRRAAKPARKPQAETASREAKAAFTLRIDPARHLRLRLACAIKNRSAQQLVTRALDDYLDAVEGLDELASRVPPDRKNSSQSER